MEIEISAFPDRMENDGDCRSRVQVSVTEKGQPCSGRSLYVASGSGEIYPLEDHELEAAEQDGVTVFKSRTDGDGTVSMGIRLPDLIGDVRLAAGTRKRDLPPAINGGSDLPDDIGLGTITLEPGKPAKLALEFDKEQAVADGVSAVRVTAVVTDGHGNPVEGQEVSFQTDLGSMDEEASNTITDRNGRATVSVSSQEVGVATVRAVNRYKSWLEDLLPPERSSSGFASLFRREEETDVIKTEPKGDVLEDEIKVEFTSSEAASMVLSVDRDTVAADGESSAVICAELRDQYRNPVKDVEVVFETDLGQIEPEGAVETGEDGKAFARVLSGKVGTASVRARTGGERNLLSGTEVVFEAASPSEIVFEVDQDEAVADGEADFTLRARVVDRMGNSVPDKTISFETDLGKILPENRRNTDKEGEVQVSVTSRKAGKARVKASCEGIDATAELNFVAGGPQNISLSINPSTEAGWKDRIGEAHLQNLEEALNHMKARRFGQAIQIMEKEREETMRTFNCVALCNLAFAYRQTGATERAEELFRSIIDNNGVRKEIYVKADGLERKFDVDLPVSNGQSSEDDFIPMDPRDYIINVIAADSHGNNIPGLELSFDSNFGWIPEDRSRAKTNSVGAASSTVTTFAPPGSSELEFAWVNLGAMKENALDYEGALKCYRSAIKIKPDSRRGLESLASVMVKTGDADGAKKCYYNLATSYSRKGNMSRAMEYYGKAIELDPKYARALSGYGSACLKSGDRERARRYLEEAVKLDRTLKAALANLALLYYLMGKFDRAIRINKRALRVDPAYRPALVNMAQIHNAQGERNKASEYMTKVKAAGT
jgi:tetratricopeptide (TPR) repeat protein